MIALSMPKIKEVENIAQNMDGCISFSQGALKIGGVDAHIKEYACQMLLTDKTDYYQAPLGIIQLRKKLAEVLSKENNTTVGLENVIISHGGVGALTSLCLTVLRYGDEVLLPEPAYPVYESIVKFSKANPIFVSVGAMGRNDNGSLSWSFDCNKLEESITSKTRMIIIANPSNPTGMCLPKETIDRLKNICEEKAIYLVIDEVYEDFIFEETFYSATSLAKKSEFVIRIGSFSKSFGMSGWRIGYIVGSHRLIKAIAPVQSASLNCPNVIAQYAILYGLEHKREIIRKAVETVKKSRDIACDFFDKLQAQGIISYVRPTAGFYIFFKTTNDDSTDLVMDILKTAKVAMVPGSDFGQSCKPFIRFCFARKPEVVTEGIVRLQKYFSAKYFSLDAKIVNQCFGDSCE